jgi:cobalt-precorrin 5A hydrolase
MIERERVALIAITKHGTERAEQLHRHLEKSALFVSSKFRREITGQLGKAAPADQAADGRSISRHRVTGPAGGGSDLSARPGGTGTVEFFETPIKELTARIFPAYDALVYFVSLGAVVRTLAPFVKDKHTDPAVLVIDDKAQFVISVLSGHVGGANELALEIAAFFGATPVITTASDVGKTIPVDILGKELGWKVELEQNITRVSAAVVNEEPVILVQETGEFNWWKRDTALPKNITRAANVKEVLGCEASAFLVITDRVLSGDEAAILNRTVIYRPKSLVAGIGCDRGVTVEEIEKLFLETFASFGLSPQSVRNISTITLKREEPGLLEFARKYGLPVVCFTKEELNTVEHLPNPSEKVKKYTGAYGVAEPSAMLSAGIQELVVEKRKIPRVTLAVARIPFALHAKEMAHAG